MKIKILLLFFASLFITQQVNAGIIRIVSYPFRYPIYSFDMVVVGVTYPFLRPKDFGFIVKYKTKKCVKKSFKVAKDVVW